MEMEVTKLTDTATLPTYGSDEAAGMDLYADESYSPHRPMELWPGDKQLIKTGISVAIPNGFYGRIAPRSGLAHKHGIDVMAGVVDSDYRGEIGVILINLGKDKVTFSAGDRIAQMIITPCARAELTEVNELSTTDRGDGGYGSTGT